MKTKNMLQALADSRLNKSIVYQGILMTKADWIVRLVNAGYTLQTTTLKKYKFSRTTFNRLSNSEQVAYEKRMAEKVSKQIARHPENGSYFELTNTEAKHFEMVKI